MTDFPGTEMMASISPDGRFVAFMSDHDGPMHLWLTQIGSGRFTDLTKGMPAMTFPRGQRALGFSGDGTEVWAASQENQIRLIPLIGGEPRPFLSGSAINPSWSPDGASLSVPPGHRRRSLLCRRSIGWQRSRDLSRRGWDTQPQSGLVPGRRVDLLRSWHGGHRKHGHLAHPAFRGPAGASHGPWRAGEHCGAAQRAHAALRGACGGSLGSLALVRRCGQPRDATGHHWSRAVPFSRCECRWPTHCCDCCEPERWSVDGPDPRSTDRRTRRAPISRTKRARARPSIRR